MTMAVVQNAHDFLVELFIIGSLRIYISFVIKEKVENFTGKKFNTIMSIELFIG